MMILELNNFCFLLEQIYLFSMIFFKIIFQEYPYYNFSFILDIYEYIYNIIYKRFFFNCNTKIHNT